MTFPSNQALLDDIVAALRPLIAPNTCVNCKHWQNKPTELCTKYAQRPPATVIVKGCPAWYPLIPF